MRAVIMAGGRGTRLQSVVTDIPKPMVLISGKPILEYQIESLKRSGIKDITIVTGFLSDIIKVYFGDGHDWDVCIDYIVEKEPLGTAGSFYYLKHRIHEDFILVFGDLLLDVCWKRFMNFHKSKKAKITLYGHPSSHPWDSDLLIGDKEGKVVEIQPKNEERNFYYHNLVNAGIYCVSPMVLEAVCKPQKVDLEKQIIADQIMKGTVYVYQSTEYVKDMGTPERLKTASNDANNGILERRSLLKKQKCIFLDRDGTINKHKGFLSTAEQFELLPGVAEAIKKINASEYLVIVATNQPVIARGECSFDELDKIHRKMETLLGEYGAYLDDIYFCPHHPDRGYEGEVSELKIVCECRKPKTGMLRRAAEKYNIDLAQSWYIGDSTMDIQTGLNAGTHTILLHTGEAGSDGKYSVLPEWEAETLLEAVELILH